MSLDGQEREITDAAMKYAAETWVKKHVKVSGIDFDAGYRAALAARGEHAEAMRIGYERRINNLAVRPRTGISCGHAGPDDAVCELSAGHDRLHLQRLERGYVEWER